MTHYPKEQISRGSATFFLQLTSGPSQESIINKPAKAWEKASEHRLAGESFRASKRSMLTARGLYPGVVVVVVGGMGLITKLKKRIETSYCSYIAVPGAYLMGSWQCLSKCVLNLLPFLTFKTS